MNLKWETIVQFFRKIIQLNAVIILKSTNEYYRKIISKNGLKMDLYPAMSCTSYRLKKGRFHTKTFPAQDRSPFCILYNMSEIWQHF